MHYIYLDTKITGAIEQLIEYFHSGIFDKQHFLVYFKSYKKETPHFSKMLNESGISYIAFKKYSDIKMAAGSAVFYLFNAQSNCRMVANRQCVHIFVTHGESNKVSSIKPIIRIYDYVTVAGKLGIRRFLDHKVFYQDDVNRKRLIMMGNTFIGQNPFSFDPQSHSVLYAPTWEGGVPEEDYSSLAWQHIFDTLGDYLQTLPNPQLVIQPHPNLGHRKLAYELKLYAGIKRLIHKGIRVVLLKNKTTLKDKILQYRHRSKFTIMPKNTPFAVREAFCDVSAMETQFYAKKIPTRIFLKDNITPIDPMLIRHYQKYGVAENEKLTATHSFDLDYYHYLLGYETEQIHHAPLNQRVEKMLGFIQNCDLHKPH